MKLHELKAFASERKQRKRKGRGAGSGLGCTAGRGNKGQNARAGQGTPIWFEGGQMPLVRRVPKRGFKNPFRVKYSVINLERIETAFAEHSEVSLDDLMRLNSTRAPIKILGRGELSRPFVIQAHRFSKEARRKIEAVGGQAKVLEGDQ